MRTAIGVDFGGTTIKSAVVSDGVIVCRGRTIETQEHDVTGLIDALASTISLLRAEAPDAVGAGIGLPGMVDSEKGIVHELSNVPGWCDVELRDLLMKQTGQPVVLENDANAMAYAEWKCGAGRSHRNVICVTLGTGVGGGLILNGALYRGSTLGAGEVGQMTIDHRGVPGHYGNFGALEKYVGNAQITERAGALYRESGKNRAPEQLTPLALGQAAHAGDAIAQALWDAVGSEIGATLADVVWLLNPDCIVLGGGIANAGELVFDPIWRVIRSRTMEIYHQRLQIVPAALGTDAGIIGAAELVLDHIAAAEMR